MTGRSAFLFSISKCFSFPAIEGGGGYYWIADFQLADQTSPHLLTFWDDSHISLHNSPTERSFIVIFLRIPLSSIAKRPLKVWPECSRYTHNPLSSKTANLKEVNSSLFQLSVLREKWVYCELWEHDSFSYLYNWITQICHMN